MKTTPRWKRQPRMPSYSRIEISSAIPMISGRPNAISSRLCLTTVENSGSLKRMRMLPSPTYAPSRCSASSIRR